MSDNRGTNRDAEAYVVSLAPDVCKTPMGSTMVPIPYTTTCKFDVAQATATRTRFGGQPVFTMGSYLPTVQGDEPGVGGGIISGVNLGVCRPVEHSTLVRVEGQWLVRHSDLMAMNCAGPQGTGNTYGKIVYIGVKTSARISPNGEIIHQFQERTTEQSVDWEEPTATEVPYDPTTDPEYQQALEDQRQAEAEIAAVEREIAWEAAKAGVDAAGLIDPTPTSDLISAGMSVAEGDWWGAGLSIISVVPYLGDAIAKPIKATRIARKAKKLADMLKKLKDKAKKLAEKLRNLRKGKKPKPGKGAPGGGASGKGPDGGHISKKTKKLGDYTYELDEMGRVKRVSGELKLKKGTRNRKAQLEAGDKDRLSTDEGGHLVANRFDGPGDAINHVPQNANLNRSAWKKMENAWAKALEQGKKVEVDINVKYPKNSLRPDEFIVKYKIDGDSVKTIFKNQAGG